MHTVILLKQTLALLLQLRCQTVIQSTCYSVQSSPTPQRDCDVGDCASLAVHVSSPCDTPREPGSHSFSQPPPKVSPASQVSFNWTLIFLEMLWFSFISYMLSLLQRIVSPETDSGFGSSYLNTPTSGSLQPHLVERCGFWHATVCKLFIQMICF